MKNQVRFLSLLIAVLLFSFGCGDEEKKLSLGEQLVGEWEVTSYTIDGVEAFDGTFDEFIMIYEDFEDGEGDFEWDVTLEDGSDLSASGSYTVDEEDKELTIEPTGSGEITYGIDVDGDELTLTYEGGSSLEVVKAERK